MLVFWGLIAGCIALDQWTKYLAAAYLRPIGFFELWPGVFRLTYAENTGAAFSIFQGHRWPLLLITGVAMAAVVIYRLRHRGLHPLLNVALALLVGGGMGNWIDRLLRGVVIDFFDFYLIRFAVFNVADVFVSVSAALLVIYILFFASREEKIGVSDT